MVNNQILGLTIVVLIISTLYILSTLICALYRFSKTLTVCSPLKGEEHYYDN